MKGVLKSLSWDWARIKKLRCRFSWLMLTVICFLTCFSLGCYEDIPALSEKEISAKLKEICVALLEEAGLSERECIFDVELSGITRGKITLTGETSEQRLRDELLVRISEELDLQVTDQIRVLPGPELEDQVWALVCKPVINLGAGPQRKDWEDVVTQARIGDILRVLKAQDDWYLVQMEDKYLGWAYGEDIVVCNKEYLDEFWDSEVALIAVKMAECLDSPGGEMVFEKRLVHGSVLPILSQKGEWVELAIPGGGSAYTKTANMLRFDSRDNVFKKQSDASGVIEVAKMYLGFPYLWGGCTSYGFDCSGFVQFCMKINGYHLRRDADLQFKQGEPVPTIAALQPGDLVFFQKDSDGPSHVGIYIGDYRFIHSTATAGVVINSFKAAHGSEYSNALSVQFCGGRRIIK